MPPLLQRLWRETTLPLKERTFNDRVELLKALDDDVHPFEVSAVLDIADAIAQDPAKRGSLVLGPRGSFLPAPKTWIEWKFRNGERQGVLVDEQDDGAVIIFADELSCIPVGMINPRALVDGQDAVFGVAEDYMPDKTGTRQALIYIWILIAIINQPRVIGRVQHMPHAGLQRRIAASRGTVGKYPMRGWSELKLEIAIPEEHRQLSDGEARLSGAKCLHFCRAHLRLRDGELQFVSSSWRGDAALGIKQTKYAVLPPRDQRLLPAELR